jgi:hypothetical protein
MRRAPTTRASKDGSRIQFLTIQSTADTKISWGEMPTSGIENRK